MSARPLAPGNGVTALSGRRELLCRLVISRKHRNSLGLFRLDASSCLAA